MLRFTRLTAVGLLLVAGCAGVDPNISNLLSAGAKLVSNPSDPPIGDLTSAELVAISTNLPGLAAQVPELDIPLAESFPILSEQQANDLVWFLDNYGITTVSQLQQLLVSVAQGETEVEVPQSLIDFAASLGFETDAEVLIAAE